MARLHFLPQTKVEGFTSTSTSGFSQLNPDAVVRELIQNSLDAAVQAKEPVAEITFKLSSIPITDLPGLDNYRSAFKAAKEFQTQGGSIPDTATNVVNNIESCLQREKIECLSVVDNGIGLDQDSLKAMLGDGISVKDVGSSGSFGNGHMVPIPTSDIRYLFYAGIREANDVVGAGHTILASHVDENDERNGPDGYYVNAAKPEFDFLTYDQLPGFVQDEIDFIKKEYEHGTVITVLGFNNFRNSKSEQFSDVVFRAASLNFFHAIMQNKLLVHIIDENSIGIENKLDSKNLTDFLEQNKMNKRSKFLTGEKACSAYNTISTGKLHTIDIGKLSSRDIGSDLGKIDARIKQPSESGNTRITLCRNGMAICTLDQLKSKIENKIPFEVVLLLDGTENTGFSRIIRKSENPLHNEISSKGLDVESAKKYRAGLKAIADYLQCTLETSNSDEYLADDILVFEGDENGKAKESVVIGTPIIIETDPGATQESMGASDSLEGPHELNAKSEISAIDEGPMIRTNPQSFRGTIMTRDTDYSCLVELIRTGQASNLGLAIFIDQNKDSSCDNIWGETPVKIKRAVDDSTRQDLPIETINSLTVVKLDDKNPLDTLILDIDYELPPQIVTSHMQRPALTLDVFSISEQNSE